MGLLIDIKKIEENDMDVLYLFTTPEGDAGKVSINKLTGECFFIEEPEYDKESKLAIRVSRVLVRYWRKGEFPEITCWVS